MKIISDTAAAKKPVVINDVMYWFAFDSMGEFAFNQDFGMMRRQEWHFAVTLFRRALSVIGIFGPTIWLIRVAFTFLPWFWKIGDWFAMLAFCDQQLHQRIKVRHAYLWWMLTSSDLLAMQSDLTNRQDPRRKTLHLSFWKRPTRKEIVFRPSNGWKATHQRSLWPEGRQPTFVWMVSWFRTHCACKSKDDFYLQLIWVFSDTTAPSLTFLSYFLAKYPEHADKLHAELDGIDPLDLNAISALPHLRGIINEAMRLYPVASTTVSRETPPQGVMIGDTFVPGHTKVVAPRWVIFRRKFTAIYRIVDSAKLASSNMILRK